MPLTTPSLAVADNADGSGNVATITGSDSASTNTLYYAPYSGLQTTLVWRSAGSRTGDGAIAVAPTSSNGIVGQYWWYALSAESGSTLASNVVFEPATDQTTSVHYRCLLATQTRLIGLALSGFSASSIIIRWQTRAWMPEDNARCPLIVLTPAGKEGQPGILTGQDDILYPINIVLVDRATALPPDDARNVAQNLLWRQEIFRALRNQRLVGVPEIIVARVEPEWTVDEAKFAKGLYWSELMYRPQSRERRGV